MDIGDKSPAEPGDIDEGNLAKLQGAKDQLLLMAAALPNTGHKCMEVENDPLDKCGYTLQEMHRVECGDDPPFSGGDLVNGL